MEKLWERLQSHLRAAHQRKDNVANIEIEPHEISLVAQTVQRLEKDYGYAASHKSFEDWERGRYHVLSVTLDGAPGFVVPPTSDPEFSSMILTRDSSPGR